MFGNRRHFREMLTRSEERIASNILADRLTRLEKAGLVSTELRTLMCHYVPAILTQNRLRAPGFYSIFTTTAVAGTQAERIYAYDSALAWPRLACSVDRLTNGVQM